MAGATGFMNSVAGGIVNSIWGDTIGLALQPLANQEQANQNQVLTNQQLNANEALSAYNYNQQYELWQKTNYPAQVQQMENAGLNPALMYHGAGPGGTTGSPSGGAGMGMATAPNMAQNVAALTAVKNTQADTDLKEAQAENIKAQTPQEAPLMNAQIDQITQGIENQKAVQVLTQMQTATQAIQNTIQGQTIEDSIATIRATATNIEQEAQSAVRNNYIDQNTMNAKIKLINNSLITQFLQNANTKAQTNLTNQQIEQIVQNIALSWHQIDINQQNANTQYGQLQLQKLINDLPISDQILRKGLLNLIPSLILAN